MACRPVQVLLCRCRLMHLQECFRCIWNLILAYQWLLFNRKEAALCLATFLKDNIEYGTRYVLNPICQKLTVIKNLELSSLQALNVITQHCGTIVSTLTLQPLLDCCLQCIVGKYIFVSNNSSPFYMRCVQYQLAFTITNIFMYIFVLAFALIVELIYTGHSVVNNNL